jgi:hypothetical protein
MRAWRTSLTIWAFMLLIFAGWLLKSSLVSAPSPPPPWGLWLSTDTESVTGGSDHEPDWLLTLRVNAPAGCSGPSTVVGGLHWKLKEVSPAYDATPPTELLLAIAGVRMFDAEMSSPERAGGLPSERTWHTVHVGHIEGAYIVHSRVSNWMIPEHVAEFRFKLMAAGSAGYGSCYVTSPSVIDSRGEEGIKEGTQEAWTNVVEDVPLYVEQHHLSERMGTTLALDSVMQLSVPREEPDRAALDAGAHVQRRSVILACTTHEPPHSEETDDRYYDYLRHLSEHFCASIQTFYARDASAQMSERNNLASLLIAVAAGILVVVSTSWWRSSASTE